MSRWDGMVRRAFADAAGCRPEDAASHLRSLGYTEQTIRDALDLLQATSRVPPWLEGIPSASPLLPVCIGEREGPTRVGPYRIGPLIGVGTFGEVYEAEQTTPLRRVVALKMLRPHLLNEAALRRFDFERDALARLSHPGIARLYDAGVVATPHGDRPYFAMEFVPGTRIDEYCRHHGLSVRDIVRLVAQVCDAVHHAHSRGIVHRDLKPSNILVEHGVDAAPTTAKVIDFGIAKAIASGEPAAHDATSLGQVLGTLAYMSPEQLDGVPEHIDTRADVYALGVVLYELLCGHRPFDLEGLGAGQAWTVVTAAPPRRPSLRCTCRSSAHRRDLRSALDWIVLRCLEVDANRRYASASELAADLRCVLDDRPIRARPATVVYQLGMLARRRRALAGAMAVAGATLLVSAVVAPILAAAFKKGERNALLAQAAAAESARAAEARAADLAVVVEFQGEQVRSLRAREIGAAVLADVRLRLVTAQESDPATDEGGSVAKLLDSQFPAVRAADVGRLVIDELVLRPMVARIDERFADRPAVRAELLRPIAQLHYGLDRPAEAARLQQIVLDDLVREGLADRFADAHGKLALYLWQAGDLAAAERHYQDAHELTRTQRGPSDPMTVRLLGNLAQVIHLQGRTAEAVPLHQEVIERIRDRLVEVPVRDAAVLDLIPLLYVEGRRSGGEPLLRDALRRHLQARGGDDRSSITMKRRLARLLAYSGRIEEAADVATEAVRASRRVFGKNSQTTAVCSGLAGDLLIQCGRFADAEPHLRTAYAILVERHGEMDPGARRALSGLGRTLMHLERWEEALTVVTHSARLAALWFGEDSEPHRLELARLERCRQEVAAAR